MFQRTFSKWLSICIDQYPCLSVCLSVCCNFLDVTIAVHCILNSKTPSLILLSIFRLLTYFLRSCCELINNFAELMMMMFVLLSTMLTVVIFRPSLRYVMFMCDAVSAYYR